MKSVDSSLIQGARQAVDVCLKIGCKDRVCIITDKKNYQISKAMELVALERTPKVDLFIMEDFGTRSEDGKNPLAFPKQIYEALSKSSVCFYIGTVKKGELQSFRTPMFNLIKEKLIRHAHMVNVTKAIMKEGMRADYNSVRKFTKKIYKYVKNAKEIIVTTAEGTSLIIKLSQKAHWLVDDGNIQAGLIRNLPAGEVYTCPERIDGNLVVDGAVGDPFKKGDLSKNPVYIKITDSRIVDVKCDNKRFERELQTHFNYDRNANRVGEVGIGTNQFVKQVVGNVLQDEKFPGFHLAFGHSFPEETGMPYPSQVHCDMIPLKSTVYVDGRLLLRNGKFMI